MKIFLPAPVLFLIKKLEPELATGTSRTNKKQAEVIEGLIGGGNITISQADLGSV